MVDVAAQHAVVRRRRQELVVLAAVVAAMATWFTGEARHIGFNGYAVANLERGYRRVDGNDLTSRLVTEDVVAANYQWADTSVVPKVNIRTVIMSVCRHLGV